MTPEEPPDPRGAAHEPNTASARARRALVHDSEESDLPAFQTWVCL
jgi:hypothetical protein